MVTQADVHWIELDSVDSTNDYLIRAFQQGRLSGTVAVFAHQQTAGRGRAGRRWQAEPGASLCLSLAVPLAGAALPFLPLCVGVAVARVLQPLQVPVGLKWPNDLLLFDQKLGGVLCESFQGETGPVTVIGIGLNIKPQAVPGALSGSGASCLQACLEEPNLPTARALAHNMVPVLLDLIHACKKRGLAAIAGDFMALDHWRGRPVQIEDNGVVQMQGVAMGINEQGAYLLDTANGLVAVHAGDLSLRVQQP